MSMMGTSTSMGAEWRKVVSSPAWLLATGFGSGLAPRAPGTAGSLAALLLLVPLSMAGWVVYAGVVIALAIVGIFVSDAVARELDHKDPSIVVIDEFAGLGIALFLVPGGWIWPLAGFVLFRLFDILKPWPIRWCDEELEGGMGIMMDDVVAGLFTLAIIQAVSFALSTL